MAWHHLDRQKKLAPIGEYEPKAYRVVVHDTFFQHRLRAASSAMRNGMSEAEFLLFCADYVLFHHRRLKGVRAIFRKGARQIRNAMAEPVPPNVSPDTHRERQRRDALEKFFRWADVALYEQFLEERRPAEETCREG